MVVEIKETDVKEKIGRFYGKQNKIDQGVVINAANEGLAKLENDADKQTEIVKAITSGKVQALQIALGMEKDKKGDLMHRADNKFGDETLANLKAGGVAKRESADEGGTNEESKTSAKNSELLVSEESKTMEKADYLLLKKEDLIKKDAGGNIIGGLLMQLNQLTITNTSGSGRTPLTDTFTFSGLKNIHDDQIEIAFSSIKSILDKNPQPKGETKEYVFENNEWQNSKIVEIADNSRIGDLETIDVDKVYQKGGLLITKSSAGWEIKIAPQNNLFFRKKPLLSTLPKSLVLSSDNSLEGCVRLSSFINSLLQQKNLKNDQGNLVTGTDSESKIDINDFGNKTFGDNNPFYVDKNHVVFSKAGTNDVQLVGKDILDKNVKGLDLIDLAKFLTNIIPYTFDTSVTLFS